MIPNPKISQYGHEINDRGRVKEVMDVKGWRRERWNAQDEENMKETETNECKAASQALSLSPIYVIQGWWTVMKKQVISSSCNINNYSDISRENRPI